jgi:hypothetical protein
MEVENQEGQGPLWAVVSLMMITIFNGLTNFNQSILVHNLKCELGRRLNVKIHISFYKHNIIR